MIPSLKFKRPKVNYNSLSFSSSSESLYTEVGKSVDHIYSILCHSRKRNTEKVSQLDYNLNKIVCRVNK